ncbi:MAG TPA: DUF4230 domain-containing protein [Armatimonadota bacterium]|nr:DUF4230 domain-containing protein [Armatimonadota bacterium]
MAIEQRTARALARLRILAVGLLLIFAGITLGKLPTGALWFRSTTTFQSNLPTVVERMQDLSRLETASFHAEKVIAARDTVNPLPRWLAGDQVLLVAHGIVTAGVDLKTMKPSDLHAEGDTVYVHLPRAAIFSTRLDDRSFVYDHHPGLLTGPDASLETQARQKAEEEIQQAAISSRILDRATTNAQSTIERLLKLAGAKTVVFQ